MGTQEGLLQHDGSGKQATQAGLPPPLQQRPIRAVYDDSAERLWLYDEATIYVRRGGRWHTRDVDASGQATGRAFAQTENGSVWIGTDGEGLFRVRGDTVATAQVRQITSADGLPSDRIRLVHADRQGRLWVGIGDRGLVRLDRQGTLPLKDDIVTTPLPPAAIERVATGDTTYTTVPGDTLRLRPEQRTFTARYAGLHFADPAAIQFRVRLQGFDRRPTRTDQRRVRYTEVNPGTYMLVVRAAGERDAWGKPARLTVTVAPF